MPPMSRSQDPTQPQQPQQPTPWTNPQPHQQRPLQQGMTQAQIDKQFGDQIQTLGVVRAFVAIIRDIVLIIFLGLVMYYGYQVISAAHEFGDRMNQIGQMFGN